MDNSSSTEPSESMQSESISEDECVLPVPRPSIVECTVRYQSPPKEFTRPSIVSKNADFYNQHDFLRSIGLNVEQLLIDFHRWKDGQDSVNVNVSDYLFSIDDEKCVAYFKEDFLLLLRKLEDDHGCGEIGMAKEIIVSCIDANTLPSISFDEKEIEEFVKRSFKCSSYGQMQTERDIFVYGMKRNMKPSCQRKLVDRLKNFGIEDERNLFLYHGTTESSARSIIVNGIRLNSRNSRMEDFGFGFYITENLDDAIHRAEIKSERTMGREKPAVIIFQLNKDEFNRHAILRLQYASNDQDSWIQPNSENLTNEQVIQWPIFVSLCLTNNPPEQFMDQYNCIIGPTTANLQQIVTGNRPQMKVYGGRIVMQISIISTTMKHVLMDGLKAVVIWEGRYRQMTNV